MVQAMNDGQPDQARNQRLVSKKDDKINQTVTYHKTFTK